jgi:uncharacterized membrane protein
MPLDPVVNFFRSQIATLPLASGGATMVITTGDGNKLPNPATDGAFNLVIYNANDPFVTPEIVRVTAKSGDSLTITRAQEGTTATNKTAGNTWFVELVNTAKMIQNIDTNKVEKTGDTMTGTLTATKLIPSGNVVTGNGMYLPAANTLAFSTNGAERVRVISTGEVGIAKTPTAGVALDVTGAVTASGLVTAGKFAPTANTTAGNGMYLPTTNQVAIGTNGTEAIRVNASQNVGIKTTSPSTPLHVTGNSFLDGTLILPANARIFTKSVTLADDTDTTLLTITAPGSGGNIQTSLLIFVSLDGRSGGTTRLSGSALYHYTYVQVTGASKASSLQDIKALNFVTQNSFLINLTSHTFTDNDVDSLTNTISAKFTSSGSGTRTFVARVTVLIQGATPAIIT